MRLIEHRYDAFISYNHGADADLAAAIERGLQRIAKPWYRMRSMSIFRDMSDTGLNPSLWGTVQGQLDGSRWLILLACPESAASRWVHQEIDHWAMTKSLDTILIVQTGGELVWDHDAGAFAGVTSALATDVADRFTSEPLWLDLRWARDRTPPPGLDDPRFKSEIARLASPIKDLPPDEIESEDLRLHRTAKRLARGAIAALVTLAIVASLAAVLAVQNANRAEREAREATARQVGLLALDLPASDLDRALLLAAAAAQLDPTDNPERFRPSRTLLGRNARLTSLLHAPPELGRTSLQGVSIGPNGASVAATAWPATGDPVLVEWDETGTSRTTPLVSATGTTLIQPDGTIVTAPVDAVVLAVSPTVDRAVIRTGTTAQLIDPTDGANVADLTGDVSLAAFGGERFVTVADGTIGVHDVSDGSIVATGDVTPAPVAVGTRGDTVVTAGPDGSVTWWQPDGGGDLVATGEPVEIGEVGEIAGLAIGPDGRRALLVGSEASALVDSLETTSLLDGATGELTVDPTLRFGAIGGTELTIWDLARGERVIDATDEVIAMAWSACDGTAPCRLVTTGRSLDVWEPEIGRRVTLSEQTNAQAVDITDDGDTVASAGWGSSIALWTLGIPIGDAAPDVLARPGTPTSYHEASATTALLADGTVVITTGESTTEIDVGPADAIGLVGDGTRVVVADESLIRLYDTTSGNPVELDGQCRSGLWATSPDGDWLAVHRVDDGATAVCSTVDGTRLTAARISGAAAPASVIAVDDDGSVALGGDGHIDHVAVERDPATTAVRFTAVATAIDVRFGGERVTVTALAAANGRIVAGLRSLSNPDGLGRVVVWDAGAGGIPIQFETDHHVIGAVAFLGANAALVTAAGQAEPDGPVTIQVWEAETRRQLGRGLAGLDGPVSTLAGDADAIVASGTIGGTYRWRLDLDPTRAICRIVGRDLTDAEWSTIADGALARYEQRAVCPS